MEDILEFKDFEYSDLFECTEIMKKNYPDAKKGYWLNLFIKDITDILNEEQFYEKNCRVALYNKKIAGFGCYKESVMATHIWELYWVNVSPEFQKRGIGTYLVKDLERDICRRQTNSEGNLIVLITDKPKFYKKLGYASVYKQGEDDFMIKYLSLEDCVSKFIKKGKIK